MNAGQFTEGNAELMARRSHVVRDIGDPDALAELEAQPETQLAEVVEMSGEPVEKLSNWAKWHEEKRQDRVRIRKGLERVKVLPKPDKLGELAAGAATHLMLEILEGRIASGTKGRKPIEVKQLADAMKICVDIHRQLTGVTDEKMTPAEFMAMAKDLRDRVRGDAVGDDGAA